MDAPLVDEVEMADYELDFSELTARLMPSAYKYMAQFYDGMEGVDEIDLDMQAKLYVYDSMRRWAERHHKEVTKGLNELNPTTCDCESVDDRHFIGCAVWRAA